MSRTPEPLSPYPPPADAHAQIARLLLPALHWDAQRGWEVSRAGIEQGLELGVGGFLVVGGEAAAVRELTAELHQRAAYPLLIASDLERGAGQQFAGATPLPPAAALGALHDPDAVRRAAELTAREARALGVNWIYAPVADVDLEPENPIIGTRAFGPEPDHVSSMVVEWIRGCHAAGALSCAKHFPGHGRTVADSHLELPAVDADRNTLAQDLKPFRGAIAAGVDSMMTAHVAYPALEPELLPATLSQRILHDLLRDQMKFDGLVVTDALIMEGFVAGIDEASGAVLALAAGCDVLLYPGDLQTVAAELRSALRDGRLQLGRVQQALRRLERAAERVAGGPVGEWGREHDRRWALETAVRTLQVVRGNPHMPASPLWLIEIEDDLGGPSPPFPRDTLPAALRRAGAELGERGQPLVVLYSDFRAWKDRPGISPEARERVREITTAEPDTTVVLFSHPRLADEIPTAHHLLAAWGGEPLMQEAAVAWLVGNRSRS